MVLVLCDGQRTADEIAQLIADQFSLDEPPLQDVTEILGKLQDQDLIR